MAPRARFNFGFAARRLNFLCAEIRLSLASSQFNACTRVMNISINNDEFCINNGGCWSRETEGTRYYGWWL